MSEDGKLTITLTGVRPVRIVKEDWPVIAAAEEKEQDGQSEFQASRAATWKIVVRRHNDGRTIVYGVYASGTQFQSDIAADVRGGRFLPQQFEKDDYRPVVAAIKAVAAELEERMPDDERWGRGRFPGLVHRCIADLPAEELV